MSRYSIQSQYKHRGSSSSNMASNLRRGRALLRPMEALTSPVTQVRSIHEDYREPAKARLLRRLLGCVKLGEFEKDLNATLRENIFN